MGDDDAALDGLAPRLLFVVVDAFFVVAFFVAVVDFFLPAAVVDVRAIIIMIEDADDDVMQEGVKAVVWCCERREVRRM